MFYTNTYLCLVIWFILIKDENMENVDKLLMDRLLLC